MDEDLYRPSCINTKKSRYGQVQNITEQFIPIYPGQYVLREQSSGLGIDHYEIHLKDGRYLRVSPDDVIHFTQHTLFNPFVGVGNITKMRISDCRHRTTPWVQTRRTTMIYV